MDRRWFVLLLAGTPTAAAQRRNRRSRAYRALTFIATAHSIEGKTADGSLAKPGTAAADPNVLPLGSRIQVIGAGRYSGVYTVTDTGPAVKGNEIDLYVTTHAAAKTFGRKRVKVIVLRRGEPK